MGAGGVSDVIVMDSRVWSMKLSICPKAASQCGSRTWSPPSTVIRVMSAPAVWKSVDGVLLPGRVHRVVGGAVRHQQRHRRRGRRTSPTRGRPSGPGRPRRCRAPRRWPGTRRSRAARSDRPSTMVGCSPATSPPRRRTRRARRRRRRAIRPRRASGRRPRCVSASRLGMPEAASARPAFTMSAIAPTSMSVPPLGSGSEPANPRRSVREDDVPAAGERLLLAHQVASRRVQRGIDGAVHDDRRPGNGPSPSGTVQHPGDRQPLADVARRRRARTRRPAPSPRPRAPATPRAPRSGCAACAAPSGVGCRASGPVPASSRRAAARRRRAPRRRERMRVSLSASRGRHVSARSAAP